MKTTLWGEQPKPGLQRTTTDCGQIMKHDLVSISKFLSLVLRHQPEVIGMKLDAEGWLPISELIANANERGKSISLELLHEVVAKNDKKRFALSDDGLRIRASQGHSVEGVELNLAPRVPPGELYHGTVANFIERIRQEGLSKRARNHVHLSADLETARKVGSRRGIPILLTVDSARMNAAGYPFHLSANGVWLTDNVPAEFIDFERA